eukprot:TRINITY_DN26_c0_g1_i6.p1 TRINITY_DN26_c0_g1~~TRINITY_DN26_c0_g1_i6.p1  ORF type:complete len:74 (+),score=31.66 TRINITY_DN26_c0_g1_i6:258-479(+)
MRSTVALRLLWTCAKTPVRGKPRVLPCTYFRSNESTIRSCQKPSDEILPHYLCKNACTRRNPAYSALIPLLRV